MSKMVRIKLKCPRCGSYIEVKKECYKFLIFRCLNCFSNVVFYENQVDLLSDEFVQTMMKSNKLRYCEDAVFFRKSDFDSNRGNTLISDDYIANLKILLNTETDFEKLLSKL